MVQVNNTPIVLRVKFFKKGRLQYISHLDLVRTMMKVIVRAGLPLWYTEGFNPKPKVVFAAPLSTGVESMCEFMDVRLTERIPESVAMNLINKNMTEEMQATEVYYPEAKLTALRWLGYEMSVLTEGCSEELAEQCNAVLSESELLVLKKTKSGEAEVNIKPMINRASVAFSEGRLKISCILSADSASFLNPEYIIKLLRARCGILSSENLMSESYTVMRTEAYTEDMKPFL